ncbi:MAG: DUF4417 domain-containing protein [Kiritimatiellia bacterium]
MNEFVQDELFVVAANVDKVRTAKKRRTDPMFLRNQFPGCGKFGIPLVRRQTIDLDNIGLIACTNTIPDDEEYFDFGVHFFVDDYDFGNVYEHPEKTYPVYSQYRFCCTPDYSVYREMPPWRQIESISHSRWCGAWWQSKGMKVFPTISWDKYSSFDYCFEGVEERSVVVVATYACRMARAVFMRGYDAMLERIQPEAIICYGEKFSNMRGEVLPIPVGHPRQFHRELKRR